MLKLTYLATQDCSGKVRWLLEEMGQKYDYVKKDWRKGELNDPAYLALHPVGQVPLLEDGDFALYESYAIVTYLADKFPGFAPPATDLRARGLYYQWLFFSTDTLEDYLNRLEKLPSMSEEYKTRWSEHINTTVQRSLGIVEKQLASGDYILGSFSAVDVCLGYAIDAVADDAKILGDYPRIRGWYERLKARPACVRSEIFLRKA